MLGALPTEEGLRREKERLRRTLGMRRDAIPPEQRIQAAQRAADRFLRSGLLPTDGGLMLYSPIRSELDPSPLFEAAQSTNTPVYLPRITGPHTLEAVAVQGPDDLTVGRFGILEPKSTLPPAPLDAIEVVLVPGIAFDESGFRLGYGAGYYDRFLPTVPEARWIGFSYEALLVRSLPRGPHDQRLDGIVTEEQFLRCTE